jgi:adenylate cyclase
MSQAPDPYLSWSTPSLSNGLGATHVDQGLAPTDDAPRPAAAIWLHCELDNVGDLLMLDEPGVTARWQQVESKARSLVDRCKGKVEGAYRHSLFCSFDQARFALLAANGLHKLMALTNRKQTQDKRMALRVGLHASPWHERGHGLATPGAQLVARLSSLAEPGETLASAGVRDLLTEDLDTTLDDLGDCFLKFQTEPVRTYRLGPPATGAPSADRNAPPDTRPTIAVIPLRARSNDSHFSAVGELVADRVITQLGRSRQMNVISRLTGTAFRDRDESPRDVAGRLQARYVLTGSYRVVGKSRGGILAVRVQLTDAQTLAPVWEDELRGSVGDLLSLESELVHAIATGAHHAMLCAEVAASLEQPLQSLNHYSLLLNGITLMHRSSGEHFQRSRQALQELLRRDANIQVAHAWLAKWYVLRVTRGLTAQPAQDAEVALQHARAARATPGAESLALAMEGFVNLHLRRDFSRASELIETALGVNPSESLAWLFGGVAHTFLNQAEPAQRASQKALSLSPLDPLLYYFESLAASSAIVARRYEEAMVLCKRSLRRNVTHLHTHRALITACWAAGNPLQASKAAQHLLRLAPGYTVRAFETTAASAGTEFGRLMGTAMKEAGIPLA